MTSHVLALCSKVLFDKQALEDRNEMERLRRQRDLLVLENNAMFCKYKYLAVMCTGLGFNYHIDAIETLHSAGALTTVLDRCQVQYTFGKPRFSFSKSPYGRCAPESVDLVVDTENVEMMLWLGKGFWGAASIVEQRAVYLFMYALYQLDSYFAASDEGNLVYDADTVDFVLAACVDPYYSLLETVPEGMLTFEEFMNEGDFGDHQFF